MNSVMNNLHYQPAGTTVTTVTLATVMMLVGLLTFAPPAQARAYLTGMAEGHTLRCSTLRSDTLPAAVLEIREVLDEDNPTTGAFR